MHLTLTTVDLFTGNASYFGMTLFIYLLFWLVFFNPSFLGGFEEGLHVLWHDIKLVFRPKIASVSTSHKTPQ
jgi:hypothetical protein